MSIPKIILLIVAVAASTIGLLMWGLPQYNVWQQGLSGQAALAKATQDRQIKIQEAQAMEEAAKHFKRTFVILDEIHHAGDACSTQTILGPGGGYIVCTVCCDPYGQNCTYNCPVSRVRS